MADSGIKKMRPEHLVVPESQKVLKNKNETKTKQKRLEYVKET